jgi:hypothetical protein
LELIPSRHIWTCAYGQITLTYDDVRGVRFSKRNHWPDMRFKVSKQFLAMVAVKEAALRDDYLKTNAA